MSGVLMIPPQPCAECGRTMRSKDELDSRTFTGICDPCAGKEPKVEAVELLDGARIWSLPPVRGSGNRLRSVGVGYPDCRDCKGKSCAGCLERRESHPTRRWMKSREERIKKALQAVYESELKREGLLDLARKNAAPVRKLEGVVQKIGHRFERVRSRWAAVVVSKLHAVSMSR